MTKKFNLQLFSEGAAGGGAGTPAGGSVSNSQGNESGGNGAGGFLTTPQSLRDSSPDKGSQGKSGNGEGSENNASASQNSSDAGNKKTDVDRQKAYDDFIAENKDLHQAHIQNIFNKRFKEDKQKDETISSQSEILNIIGQKYGIKDGDIAALRKAVEEDNSYLEEAAEREGVTVDQYREITRLRAESERNRRAEAERQAQSELQRQMDGWFREGVLLKETYPDFDFRGEMQNVSFRRLLQAGIPLKTAYETIHMDDILNTAREDAKKQTVDNIRGRQDRPSENGLNGSGGFVLGKDVSSMTKKERRELNERARRGEKIVL